MQHSITIANFSFSSLLSICESFLVDSTNHAKNLLLNRDPDALWQSATVGLTSLALATLIYKTVNYCFINGPVRQLVNWKLNASTRRALTKKIVDERDRNLAALVSWAESDKDGCSSPTLAERRELTELSIVELRERMSKKKLSPVFLLKACIINTKEANELTNCISSVVFGEDIEASMNPIKLAIAAEKKYRDSGDAIDFKEEPLLGIPMSVKECLKLRGTYATAGCYCFASEGKSVQSAATVELLRAAGAVIFVKTNVPQTMLSYDCQNNIFGSTHNPWKRGYSPGGSSGGEAALVACRGSIAGIGTDIGGSNRIPQSFCGVFGLRPSLWRVPAFGSATPTPGQESISSTAGPCGRSISDLVEVFRAMVAEDACKIDGTINCIPFRDEMFNKYAKEKKSLKIGFYTDDGFLVSSPATRRAILEVVEKLKTAGHQVTEFSPDCIVDVMQLFFRLVAADGCDTVAKRFDNFEPPMPAVIITYLKARALPDFFFRNLVPFFLKFKSEIFAKGIADVKHMSAAEFFDALRQRNDLRHEFARAIAAFDCVITPTTAIPAPKIGSTFDKPYGVSYTAAINVLDQSSVVIPTGFVDPERDAWSKEEFVKNNNSSGQKNKFDIMDKKMRSIYDEKEMAGFPLSIQVLTPRSSEERALGCAQQICDVLKESCPKPPSIRQ